MSCVDSREKRKVFCDCISACWPYINIHSPLTSLLTHDQSSDTLNRPISWAPLTERRNSTPHCQRTRPTIFMPAEDQLKLIFTKVYYYRNNNTFLFTNFTLVFEHVCLNTFCKLSLLTSRIGACKVQPIVDHSRLVETLYCTWAWTRRRTLSRLHHWPRSQWSSLSSAFSQPLCRVTAFHNPQRKQGNLARHSPGQDSPNTHYQHSWKSSIWFNLGYFFFWCNG